MGRPSQYIASMVNATKNPTKNPELAKGVRALGRYAQSKKSHKFFYAGKKQKFTKAEKPAAKCEMESRYYSAVDVKKPIPSRKGNHKPTRLRKSITPGTVLIVLAGRFKGKRVVFLKQLDSGLLLVTGPYKINGVPLRRINQVYAISTSTKVDVSGVDVSNIDDAFFKKAEGAKKKSGGFFDNPTKTNVITEERKSAQKAVDEKVTAVVEAVPVLHHYLNAKFSLTRGQYPHQLKF